MTSQTISDTSMTILPTAMGRAASAPGGCYHKIEKGDAGSRGHADFARGLAGPALEGVGEGADFTITEQPGNLGNRQAAAAQLLLGKVDAQIRQHAREGEALRRQPPPERTPAHAEPD